MSIRSKLLLEVQKHDLAANIFTVPPPLKQQSSVLQFLYKILNVILVPYNYLIFIFT